MWLVEGAFDQKDGINLEQKKLKLLKPGRSYPLGRKPKHPLQLVLSHPKISGEHITIIVGENSVNTVDDPACRPTLKVQSHRSKPLQVNRTVKGSMTRHFIQPMSDDEVMDGDCIALVAGIYITINWRPICCFLPPKSPPISFETCAALGIKVVSTPRPEITHHLTPTLSVSTSLATSLLTLAHIVRPEWLAELLHLGTTATSADGPSSLESDFRLPALAQYVPKPDPALPTAAKSPAVWEPNERRAGMLRGWRLLFALDKGRELDGEARVLVERSGGEYEVFDVSGGLTRWKQALSRNRRKAEAEGGKGISVIAETEALKTAAADVWDDMLEELKRSELCFVSRSKLLEAVFFLDTSRINSSLIVETEKDPSLPDRVSNTHEENTPPSEPPQSIDVPVSAASGRHKKRALVAQATNSAVDNRAKNTDSPAQIDGAPAPISAPVEGSGTRLSVEPEGIMGRRKPLVRRAKTNATQPQLLGVDDPTFDSFALSQFPAPETLSGDANDVASSESQVNAKPPSSFAVPTGRPSRLKKRVRTDKDYNPILASLEEQIAAVNAPPAEQPPLKRFKALFDETDPDRVASQMTNGASGSGGILDSQMFSQTPSDNRDDNRDVVIAQGPPLAVIREEEESQTLRPASAVVPEDIEMPEANDVAPPNQSQLKPHSKASGTASQSHAEPFDSTKMTKRTASKGGAAPGKPDTDAAFLQALASTKKGKRREDDFDREFNNLRISKPEHDHEAEAEAEDWRVLADFGDDNNIRGNFMIIVEMDVTEKRKDSSRDVGRAQSRGPDFKKFKKKTLTRQRPSVELVAEDQNDYGMGPAYWKGSQSQAQSQGVTHPDASFVPQQDLPQPSQTQDRGFLQPQSGISQSVKPRSRTQARTQSRATKAETQGATQRSKSRRLRDVEGDGDDSDEVLPPATRRTRATTNGKAKVEKNQALFLSDEGEDERNVAVDGQDRGEVDLDLDFDDAQMSDGDEPGTATLRSPTQSNTGTTKTKPAPTAKRGASTKKRGAAILDDDSDTGGVAFKGFGSRKKTRAK